MRREEKNRKREEKREKTIIHQKLKLIHLLGKEVERKASAVEGDCPCGHKERYDLSLSPLPTHTHKHVILISHISGYIWMDIKPDQSSFFFIVIFFRHGAERGVPGSGHQDQGP